MSERKPLPMDIATSLQILIELRDLNSYEFNLERQQLTERVKRRLQEFIQSFDEADNDL